MYSILISSTLVFLAIAAALFEFTVGIDVAGRICPHGYVKCRNGRLCISQMRVCDGENSCGDYSDEFDCPFPTKAVCGASSFQCDNGRCINLKWRCDGEKDCSDGSDEINCDEELCNEFGCSDLCNVTSAGPTCYCKPGYQLTEDNKTCTDIDECAEWGYCSQTCTNHIGNSTCSCDIGYILNKDGKTCDVSGPDPLLIITKNGRLIGVNIKSMELSHWFNNELFPQAVGVSSDVKNNYIYWTDLSSMGKSIRRTHLETEKTETLFNLSQGDMPESIAVDWVGGNIYLSDSKNNYIFAAKQNITTDSIIPLLKEQDHPRAIVVIPQIRKMYWTVWGDMAAIKVAGMDGSNPLPIVSNNLEWPNGLAVDYTNKRLYWTDGKNGGIIETTLLDGTDRKVVSHRMFYQPYALAVFQDRLYWSDWFRGHIVICNKFNCTNTQHHVESPYPMGMTVVHPVLQPEMDNPCENVTCQHLCLLSPEPNGCKCGCPFYMELEEDGIMCRRPVDCINAGCSHECVVLPTGVQCICPHGLHLESDNKTCNDIDECLDWKTCSQICENNIGNYSCSCEDGYILKDDGISCKTNETNALLIYMINANIRGFYLNSGNNFTIQSNVFSQNGLTVDAHGNYVYWTDTSHSEVEIIKRTHLHNGTMEDIVTTGLLMPESLALDWVTNNIYFTDTKKNHIAVCDISDGEMCVVLIANKSDFPKTLIVLPQERHMYWTNWGSEPSVKKAGMDGSNPHSIIKSGLLWPNGLTCDYPHKRLYWADAKMDIIESASMDGSNRRMVLKGIVNHSWFSLAVFENSLYFSDWKQDEIHSCNKFNCQNQSMVLKETGLLPMGITIIHPTLQPKVENPCKNAICSHLCLLAPQGQYKCACPNEMILQEDRAECQINKTKDVPMQLLYG